MYLSFEFECEKNENKQKEAGNGLFFKNYSWSEGDTTCL